MNSPVAKAPTRWSRSIEIRFPAGILIWSGATTKSSARKSKPMLLANLVFSAWNWLWLAAAVLGLGAALLTWSYWRRPSPIRWPCLVLKILGFAALAVCLLEPLWSGQRARPGANIFAVVADNSQGLQIKDRGETRTRGEVLRELLNPQKRSWETALAESFDLRRYFFDSRIQSTKDWSDLAFDGRAT